MILQNPQYTQGALAAPDYPNILPTRCKWLGGEGYGVWFLLTKHESLHNNEYRIRRFSDKGNLDCDRVYALKSKGAFFIDKEFEFAYISHCQKTTVAQNGKKFIFEYIRTFVV